MYFNIFNYINKNIDNAIQCIFYGNSSVNLSRESQISYKEKKSINSLSQDFRLKMLSIPYMNAQTQTKTGQSLRSHVYPWHIGVGFTYK